MTESSHSGEAERLERIEAAVMHRIGRRRLRTRRARASAAGVLVFGAALCLIPAFGYAYAFAKTSGFIEYASLATSDWSAVAGSWRPLLMSLVGSAPILGAVFATAALFIGSYAALIMLRALDSVRDQANASLA